MLLWGDQRMSLGRDEGQPHSVPETAGMAQAVRAISRHIVTFQSPTEAPVDLRDDDLAAQAVEGDLYNEVSWLSYDLSWTSARAAENCILLDAAARHSCLHTRTRRG
jgi:hypothetical protein